MRKSSYASQLYVASVTESWKAGQQTGYLSLGGILLDNVAAADLYRCELLKR